MLSIFFNDNANACTCGASNTMSEAFNSDLIFKGTVLNSRFENQKSKRFINMIYTIQVEKIYKGHYKSKIIEIISPSSDEECGFEFDLNKQYIIYSWNKREYSIIHNLPKNSFYTNKCTRTNQYQVKEEVEIKKFKRKHFFWWLL